MSTPFIQFADQSVPYNRFLDDLAQRLAERLRPQGPDYISQNEAFRRFGRKNVERWRNTGRIEPCKRPGKMEYPVVELLRLQATHQDYF